MSANYQLFILPFAGSKAEQFDDFASIFSPNIDVLTMEYAGRGRRNKEPFFVEYKPFIHDVCKFVKTHRDYGRSCVLLGYSIGGLFAYDLIAKGYLEQPDHLFICACEYSKESMPVISDLPEDVFWDRVIQLGGVDKRLIEKRKFLKLFSKTLRADFNIGEQHRFNEEDKAIDCPVSILYSETDTPFRSVKGWQDVCNKEIRFHEFQGEHFFLLEDHLRVSQVIKDDLKIKSVHKYGK